MSQKKSKVGYKNPPKETQWPKGTSGNPSGKAKKPAPKLLMEELADQLNQPVTLGANGKTEQVTFSKAMAIALLRDWMKAPLKDKILGLERLEKLGVLSMQEKPLSGDGIYEPTPNDLKLLEIVKKDVGIDDDSSSESAW